MTVREQLNSIAEERIIILDGAMGSLIQVLNLDEKSYRGSQFADHPIPLQGCNDLLCLTRPGAIGVIHDTYLEAGADIIETCSFNSTSVSLSEYGLGHLSYDISKAAAQIARKSADKFSADSKPRFVAGSIGPTSKGASLYPDINNPAKRSICWDELEAAYYDNARGLLDGGADIFLAETIFDTLNVKAALFAISRLLEERQIDVPVIISAAISGESGRLLSGQSLEAFCISVLHADPWAIGLNCSYNAPKLLPHLKLLSENVPCFVSAYPNAGLPNKFGRYDEMPDVMAANIEPYFEEKLVNIIGGCCGSSPAHIAAIAEKASGYAPRPINRKWSGLTSFAGLEPCHSQDNLLFIDHAEKSAEREEFQKCLNNGEYEDAADAARDLIENGESILNIELKINNPGTVCVINSFLDYALMNPYISNAPFLIHCLDFNVLEAGLKRLQGRGLAGPVSLKAGEEQFLQKIRLIRRYGAAAIVTLETDTSKDELEKRVCQLLEENGIPLETVVFDRDYCPDADSAL